MKEIAKTLIKRKIIGFLLSLLAPVLPFLVIFLLLTILVAAVYSAMIPGTFLTGVEPSEKDKILKEKYETLAGVDWSQKGYNGKDCYLVGGEPFKSTRLYPSKQGRPLGVLGDKFGLDYQLKLKWGTIHSVGLFYAMQHGLKEIPEDMPEKVAGALHPYYYYIERQESACGKDGCSTWTVRLLVEAHTIYGWYQYHYKQVTKHEGDVTLTVWELDDTVQLYPDPRQFFKDKLAEICGITDRKSLDTDSQWVLEAGEGFTAQKEWLAFLSRSYEPAMYISAAGIPPQYKNFLKEAEEKFGVPAWFMAALIQRESSWDMFSVNSLTGCFGLTQQHPSYYAERYRRLGFDPEKDKFNPRAQILAGALTLIDYAGKIDWSNWKNDANLKAGLARYGGYPSVTLAEPYISSIFQMAESFSTQKSSWPIDSRTITVGFGEKSLMHPEPHTGIDIAAPRGTPVRSVSAAVVCYTGYTDTFGWHIKTRDAQFEYLYAHLDQILVSQNQVVHPGDVIGLSGNTGRSTGPHLHFSVYDLQRECFINPLAIFG